MGGRSSGSRTSAWRAPETRRRPGTVRSAATTWSPGMEQIGMRPRAPSVRLASGCPEASCHVDLPDRASRDKVAVAALGPAREHDGRGHEHREHEPGVHRGSIGQPALKDQAAGLDSQRSERALGGAVAPFSSSWFLPPPGHFAPITPRRCSRSGEHRSRGGWVSLTLWSGKRASEQWKPGTSGFSCPS